MSATPWIIGGVAVGVGLLWIRNRSKPTPPPKDPAKDAPKGGPCEYLRPLGDGAVASCLAIQTATKVGSVLIDLLPDGPDFAARDQTNLALNGEVELQLGAVRERSMCIDRSPGGGARYLLNGSALRFKNGCVPFQGAPGWEKCAAGTQDMSACGWSAETYKTPLHGTPAPPVDWKGSLPITPARLPIGFTGVDGDPFTAGPWRAQGEMNPTEGWKAGGYSKVGAKFPLAVSGDQQGWYIQGRPIVCNAGQHPQIVRDHRTGKEAMVPVCVAVPDPNSRPVPPPRTTPPRAPPNTDPANYCVDTLPEGGTYVRRARAGEQCVHPETGPVAGTNLAGVVDLGGRSNSR